VAALAGPAVQEQQWRRARVTPDVGVEPVPGEPRVLGAHAGIMTRARGNPAPPFAVSAAGSAAVSAAGSAAVGVPG
jgi:hypothetical protein